MSARFLILETSGRVGQVALAQGDQVLGTRRLEEARRHARDLAAAVFELLQEQGWNPGEVDAAAWDPRPQSLLQIALPRFHRNESDDLWRLEPLYGRPSSAEEQWQATGR